MKVPNTNFRCIFFNYYYYKFYFIVRESQLTFGKVGSPAFAKVGSPACCQLMVTEWK